MKLKNMKTFEQHSSELNISDVSDSNFFIKSKDLLNIKLPIYLESTIDKPIHHGKFSLIKVREIDKNTKNVIVHSIINNTPYYFTYDEFDFLSKNNGWVVKK